MKLTHGGHEDVRDRQREEDVTDCHDAGEISDEVRHRNLARLLTAECSGVSGQQFHGPSINFLETACRSLASQAGVGRRT